MTAATLVGLMSIPALAVLYGGLVQRKWAVNTVLMVFSTFCLTLIVWVLWAFKMGFGQPWIGGRFHLLGKPQTGGGASGEQSQALIPRRGSGSPNGRGPEAARGDCQCGCAAITPIRVSGSGSGRSKGKVG